MEDKGGRPPHRIVVADRQQLEVAGVLNVDSFDDREIVLETEGGVLLVRGEDLHVRELNLEGGRLLVTGLIIALEYQGEGALGKGKGLLSRLFR